MRTLVILRALGQGFGVNPYVEKGGCMADLQRTFSPIDGTLLCERSLAEGAHVESLLDRSVAAQVGLRAMGSPARD